MADRIEMVTLPGKAGYHVNIYLIRGKEGSLMVDTGYQETSGQVLEMIRFREVKRILLTHSHPDHSDAAGILAARTGAELLVHRLEAQMIKEWFGGTKVISLEDGEPAGIDGAEIKAVHTPGHSPGHLSFYLEEERVLFSGDLVVGESTSWVGPPDGDIGKYLDSLQRLRGMKISRIFPGHGPEIGQPREKIDALIRHRNMRERQILSHLRRGISSVREMVDEIYPVLDERFRIAARLTIIGHLIKLEREGKVIRVAGEDERYQLLPGSD